MNEILYYIPYEHVVGLYARIKDLLSGYDQVIFDSMAEVTKASGSPFQSTSDSSLFDAKHKEIEKRLQYRTVLRGLEIALDLFAEIFKAARTAGSIAGLSPDVFLEEISLDTTQGFKIRLTAEECWAVVWAVKIKTHRTDDGALIIAHVHSRSYGSVVPSYIVEYLDSAIHAYSSGMHGAAAALVSIAVEATLRDVLATKGYAFLSGSPSVDVYRYSKAHVDGDMARSCFVVQFQGPMPRDVSDFVSRSDLARPLEVQIKRRGSNGRFDLILKAEPELIDYWSDDTVTQHAQKTISGLGAALNIARNVESLVSAQDLPTDFDSVLRTVRNNLIHLSSEALDTPLPGFARSGSSSSYTLRDFLSDPEMVYDLVRNVPQFIDEQYLRLRREGYLSP